MGRRETPIQNQILAAWGCHPLLRITRTNTGVGWFARGMPARKTDVGAYPVRFNLKGTGDLTGLIAPNGRLLMIECKSTSGTSSQAQKRMQRIITSFGGLYIVARSIADVDAALATMGIYR